MEWNSRLNRLEKDALGSRKWRICPTCGEVNIPSLKWAEQVEFVIHHGAFPPAMVEFVARDYPHLAHHVVHGNGAAIYQGPPIFPRAAKAMEAASRRRANFNEARCRSCGWTRPRWMDDPVEMVRVWRQWDRGTWPEEVFALEATAIQNGLLAPLRVPPEPAIPAYVETHDEAPCAEIPPAPMPMPPLTIEPPPLDEVVEYPPIDQNGFGFG